MLGGYIHDNELSESLNDGKFIDSFTEQLSVSERSCTL